MARWGRTYTDGGQARRQADRQTGRHRQTARQAGTDRRTDQQGDRQTYTQTDRQKAGTKQVEKLNRQANWAETLPEALLDVDMQGTHHCCCLAMTASQAKASWLGSRSLRKKDLSRCTSSSCCLPPSNIALFPTREPHPKKRLGYPVMPDSTLFRTAVSATQCK